MKLVQDIEIDASSKEEQIPGLTSEFPYMASCAKLDRQLYPGAPWHWHRAVELFYIQSGSLDYTTPHGKWVFPAGSGGLVNTNVLHASQLSSPDGSCIQLLHLFDPVFLTGDFGNRLAEKYILPLTSANWEMIPLYPEDPDRQLILTKIRNAFAFDPNVWGYEFQLRESLTDIWLKLFALAQPDTSRHSEHNRSDALMKALMVYVHENYSQPLSVDQLADSVHISKRSCFRIFQDHLHMTPVEYIREYRLQRACQMLKRCDLPITQIAYASGLGSSSYFGKLFRERFGCTPAQYRKKWNST